MYILENLYEKYLSNKISLNSNSIPSNITLVISETDILNDKGMDKLKEYILWCRDLYIKVININVDVLEIEASLHMQTIKDLLQSLEDLVYKIPNGIGFEIYDPQGNIINKKLGHDMNVYVAIDFGGRYEITKAVKAVLEDVKLKKIKAEDISEKDIESHLMFKHEPDLLIKTGGTNLSDFMIWQSIYSEIIFIDVNWNNFRKIDLLRVLRDFQKRQRRYGK